MNKIIEQLRERAKKDPKRIVFPESDDSRVVEAVKIIEKEKIAIPLLLSHDNFDPKLQEQFAADYFTRKQAKGITLEEARQAVEDPLTYGAMLLRFGHADGFVAGAKYTTSSVLRAAIGCLNIDRSARVISSCFIMAVPDSIYGSNGVLIYADCGVIPYPTSEQLAGIAISAAKFAKNLLEVEPKVALLSFSTKGSAEGVWIDKIKEAVKIANEREPSFLIDGELQADAALDPEVAKIKLKDSKVAGQANVLIFPNLDAGNICYKITQRLAKARAIGPIVLGTVQPCSDLSRGCSVEDIVDCAAVTVIRAQKRAQAQAAAAEAVKEG